MEINIHHYHHYPSENPNLIIKKLDKIMGAIEDLQAQSQDLQAQVVDLQASVDAEQEQIAALLATNAQVVTDLNAQIVALEAAIAAGATADQLAEISAGLSAAASNLATAKADVEGTV